MEADHYARGLVEFIKPLVMGRNPQDIGAIWPRFTSVVDLVAPRDGALR